MIAITTEMIGPKRIDIDIEDTHMGKSRDKGQGDKGQGG
jgi:hypothetical protein